MRKYAIVLGGSGGIGSEIADVFAEMDISPIIVDKSPPKNNSYKYIFCDLSSEKTFIGLMKSIAKISSQQYYMVNAAGIFEAHNDGVFSKDRLKKVNEVNVFGALGFINEWYENFGKHYGGVVVNISSAAARRPTLDVAYGMSKAALDSATLSLARTWAPKCVWVFGVAPGLVATNMAKSMAQKRRKILADNSLLGRESQPREVAELVVSATVSSPQLLTGTIIDVSGGIR